MFQLLAHNCWCQACFNSAHQDLGFKAGVVCGHGNGAGAWSCVYCGAPVYRHTPWPVALYQSVRSWAGWVKWEIQLWWWGIPRG